MEKWPWHRYADGWDALVASAAKLWRVNSGPAAVVALRADRTKAVRLAGSGTPVEGGQRASTWGT